METVIEIEDYLHTIYLKDYKKKQTKERCPINNNEYIIDKLKLEYLSEMIPFELELDKKIELKESKIHGLGVFAKQKINKGELITFYPGDFVEYTSNEDRHLPHHLTILFRSKRLENRFGQVTDSSYRNSDYGFDLNNHYAIIGCPQFNDDTNYMGHFINDGARTNSTEKSNEIYLEISKLKRNCKFHILKDLHVAIISTKNINIDEELYVTYGISYWFNKNKE